MTDIAIDLDEHNRDVLYARRVEMFFEPNEDGTESLNGKVVWHTEWWHYSGALLRGKSLGPRIERSVESILAEEYAVGDGSIPAAVTIGAIKAAYVKHAREHFGLDAPIGEDADLDAALPPTDPGSHGAAL